MEPIKLIYLSNSAVFVCQDKADQARLWQSLRAWDDTLIGTHVRTIEGDCVKVDPLMLARVARAVTMEGFKLLIS